MLVSKIKSVHTKLEKRAALIRTSSELDLLEQIQKRLHTLRREAKRTAEVMQALPLSVDERTRREIEQEASQVLVTVKELREDFDAGKRYTQQVRVLQNIAPIAEWEQKLTQAWLRYFAQRTEENTGLAQVIEPYIPADRREILAAAWAKLAEYQKLPRNTADVGAFEEALSQYKSALEMLGAEFPPEVRGFLQKLNAGRATLHDITPGILAWCQDKGIDSRLYINARLSGRLP